MKNFLFALAMLIAVTSYAQSKKNGTIYIEHPAIDAVENMVKAYVEGDAEKAGSYLSDDFKAFRATNPNPDATGQNKENYLNGINWWQNNISYFSIKREEGAYPDALEYKDDDQKDVIWVQTWERLRGVHNETGVKMDMPMYRMFIVNKDNKITRQFGYFDRGEWQEVGASFSTRTNGTLYKYHENINKVRRMVRAFEHGDLDKAYSFFDENADFRSIHMPRGENNNLEENRANTEKILESFEIESIDMVGYPDYLHYEQNDSRVVQSWWNFRIKRKADGKKIKLPVFYIHDFNEEGKITGSSVYYSAKLMEE